LLLVHHPTTASGRWDAAIAESTDYIPKLYDPITTMAAGILYNAANAGLIRPQKTNFVVDANFGKGLTTTYDSLTELQTHKRPVKDVAWRYRDVTDRAKQNPSVQYVAAVNLIPITNGRPVKNESMGYILG
jgi:hypothetical protein